MSLSWLDALGWAGSALLVFSVMQARVLRFRLLNLVACLVLMVFNGFLQIWPMVAMNAALTLINLYFLRRLISQRHDSKAYEAVRVRPDDEYLRHVLKVHAVDISKFQPGFAWDNGLGARHAYLVLKGDETVGVVLVEDVGAGVAKILLDYVTPRFRDFSPGEFVWRQSPLLRATGFRRVVSPKRMVRPYYGRVGFKQVGDIYTLDLPD